MSVSLLVARSRMGARRSSGGTNDVTSNHKQVLLLSKLYDLIYVQISETWAESVS